jgi:hypothetical protein
MPTRICLGCNKPFRAGLGAANRCRVCAHVQVKKISPVRGKVNRALRQGILVRQPCEVCGAIKVDAHHDDYDQPLAVRWLCRTHHHLHHAAERRALRVVVP